ncbi:uncharacterized protein LOC111086901 isoform X2 [Limulus polyphemus]|uniref:Uncharacterized protein LOC111086901 isoform X2 n=1 Tax=Limulus polyphemus TaxID=6850 RepID=A0ABM1SUN7_LIMPO|nr:uncharacterized protein LOC111086901 isoform X2 [Limulus polyphemus]
MMDDDVFDIRQIALRRQQRRLHARASVEQLLETEAATFGKCRSSSFDTKNFGTNSNNGTQNTFVSTMAVPLFEDDSRLSRMHVPPIVKCECNGVEGYALINTGAMATTISMNMVKKLRQTDQIVHDASAILNPLGLPLPEFKGKVKYVDLTLGRWHQVSQFFVVDDTVPEVSLGVDFLRKTQLSDCVCHLLIGHITL